MLVAGNKNRSVSEGLTPKGLALPPLLDAASLDLMAVSEADRDTAHIEDHGQVIGDRPQGDRDVLVASGVFEDLSELLEDRKVRVVRDLREHGVSVATVLSVIAGDRSKDDGQRVGREAIDELKKQSTH
jgi:hypothetical protein